MATKGGHKTEDARKRAAKRRGDESAAGGGGAKAMEARKGVSSANILCTICRAVMLQTASLDQLATHVENKHAGKTFAECFPDRAAAYAARADKK